MRNPGRLAVTWAVPGLLAAALGIAFRGPGLAVAIILALVWLAWRFDNSAGTFLVLAVLLLIAVTVPAMLLVLMAVVH